jgi:hypothetical protein
VDRDYDLFEIMPDGTPLWRQAVTGHDNAISALKELASKTKNEVRIMHLPTSSVIATVNVPKL